MDWAGGDMQQCCRVIRGAQQLGKQTPIFCIQRFPEFRQNQIKTKFLNQNRRASQKTSLTRAFDLKILTQYGFIHSQFENSESVFNQQFLPEYIKIIENSRQMSTSCKETDCDLLNLIEPLLDDESTQDSGSETGFSAQGYQTKYKTEKCRYWAIGQTCPFGESCSFAHGMVELRSKAHLSKKYKTKVCLNFEKTGSCKYGDRCQFLHPVAKPKLQQKKTTFDGFYVDLLEHLCESSMGEQNIPVRRLKFFEEFELDSFENVDWRYKKSRLYSI